MVNQPGIHREDPALLHAAYKEAAVHRYVDEAQVCANASMIFVHVHQAGRRRVHLLPAGTRGEIGGTEFFSGTAFVSHDGGFDWDFQGNDVCLFLLDA